MLPSLIRPCTQTVDYWSPYTLFLKYITAQVIEYPPVIFINALTLIPRCDFSCQSSLLRRCSPPSSSCFNSFSLFFYSLVIICLRSLFHLSSLCLVSLQALTVSSSVSQLSLFPLPYIPLSLPPSLSIDPAIVFCLPCAGWLALINIDNCLLSLHAKHAVFFLNESRSFPYATRLHLPPSPPRGNPSVNDRR